MNQHFPSTTASRPVRPPHRALALAAALAGLALVPAAEAAVPYQFIAKMYTEALGRIPDQGGWQGGVNFFTGNACNQANLRTWGRGVYLSAEYTNLAYDNAARVLTLYRGVLNREPDLGGFNNWVGQLNAGTPWATVIDAFFNSAEFAGIVGAICNLSSYSFGNAAVIDLPITTGGFQGSQSQLQTTLNNTPSGGTVQIAQKEVIRLSSMLVIPAGRTLTTLGAPPHTRYALMARLVRNSTFNGPAVRLMPGAKLKNVWVDGARGRIGDNRLSLSVQLLGGAGTEVSGCLISNASGWTSLQAFGSAENQACGSNFLRNNLITVYSSNHCDGTWADGLSISCENATAENNEIVDATDVPIVVYRACPAVQRSVVRNNLILNAGNSAYGGLGADGLFPQQTHPSCAGLQPSFAGTSFANNTLWTSGRTHYDITLAVGTRAWFGTNSTTGTGASFTGNTTGSQSARTDLAIGVSGMLNCTVQGNALTRIATNVSPCPNANIGVMPGFGSGSIQQPIANVTIEGCITSVHQGGCP
jgi:hypothetical protein